MELFVAMFLFLIGTGAGTIAISSGYIIRDKILTPKHNDLVKYSISIGTIFLIIGVFIIVCEILILKNEYQFLQFDKLSCFSKIFILFITNPLMNYLVVLLSVIIPICIVYLLSFSLIFNFENKRILLAKISLFLSLVLCSTTSFLLHGIINNILWNNLLMVILFILSTLCSGLSIILLLRTLIFKIGINIKSPSVFSKANFFLLVFGFFIILLFILALSFISISDGTFNTLSLSYLIGKLWWFGVVGIGFLIPLFLYLFTLFKPLNYRYKYFMISCILSGTFCLKYTILLSGEF